MFSTESIGFWLKHERVNQYRNERGGAGSQRQLLLESVGKFKKITLKAFANFSPGRGPRPGSPRGVGAFALKPWVKKGRFYFVATLKELRRV